MMLLITASRRADECAAALQNACGDNVQTVTSCRAALALLRMNEYRAVVFDDSLMEPDPLVMDAVVQNTGAAAAIYVNFAISNLDRIVREVQTALQRREIERATATRLAVSALQSELNSAVAGILLSSELALNVPGLPRDAEVKIRYVRDLAQEIRQQLESQGAAAE